MGMGAAGMVAAKTAADNGAHVLIAEKMNEALSGEPCGMFSALHQDAINTGASMLVGTDGHRFLNESEIVHHGHLYENGIWENPTFPEHVHYVCDET